MPGVDRFLPIEEVGFDFAPIVPIRTMRGCRFLTDVIISVHFVWCLSPGAAKSIRPFSDIIAECKELAGKGIAYNLVGQNVNSYGADLLVGEKHPGDAGFAR